MPKTQKKCSVFAEERFRKKSAADVRGAEQSDEPSESDHGDLGRGAADYLNRGKSDKRMIARRADREAVVDRHKMAQNRSAAETNQIPAGAGKVTGFD